VSFELVVTDVFTMFEVELTVIESNNVKESKKTKSIRGSLAILGLALISFGCESYTPNNRDIGLATGTALGAGLGAIVGNQVGDPGEGVAIGAAAGAIAGGLIGNAQDSQEDRTLEQEEVLRRQEAELQRQQREIEELRRQRYQDNSLRSSYSEAYGGQSGKSGITRSAGAPESRVTGSRVTERTLDSSSYDSSGAVDEQKYESTYPKRNESTYQDEGSRDDYRY
jgi:uncharacterized protein YcfJ